MVNVSSIVAQSPPQLSADANSGPRSGLGFVPAGTLYDNGQSDGSTSLASQDSNSTFAVRTADDFLIHGGGCPSGEFQVARIRTQVVQSDAAPQPFQLDIYHDGTAGGPAPGASGYATLVESSRVALGVFGVGTTLLELSFDTPDLIISGDTRYWLSAYGANAALNLSGFNTFFAAAPGAAGTVPNGVIIAPNAGIPNWTPVQTVIGGGPLAFSFAIDGVCRPLEADLSVHLQRETALVVPGLPVTYTLTVLNLGPAAATNASLSHALNSPLTACSWSCVSAGGASCGAAAGVGSIAETISVPVGSTLTYQTHCEIPAAATGSFSTMASVQVADAMFDPDSSNNAMRLIETLLPQSDLSVALLATPDPVTAGTELIYTASVGNAGASDATDVRVTIAVPSEATVTSVVMPDASCAGLPIECRVNGRMAAGETRVATIRLLVAPETVAPALLTGRAEVHAESTDPVVSNNSAEVHSAVVASADLQLQLSTSSAQVLVNAPISVSAIARNQGPSVAHALRVSIDLQPDLRFAGQILSNGSTCLTPQLGASGRIECLWLGSSADMPRSVQFLAVGNTPGQHRIDARVTAATADPVADNNQQAVFVRVGDRVAVIPTLDGYGRGILVLLLLAMAVLSVKARRPF